jgi:hypothetical protein
MQEENRETDFVSQTNVAGAEKVCNASQNVTHNNFTVNNCVLVHRYSLVHPAGARTTDIFGSSVWCASDEGYCRGSSQPAVGDTILPGSSQTRQPVLPDPRRVWEHHNKEVSLQLMNSIEQRAGNLPLSTLDVLTL